MGRRCALTEHRGNPISNITLHTPNILNITDITDKPKGLIK